MASLRHPFGNSALTNQHNSGAYKRPRSPDKFPQAASGSKRARNGVHTKTHDPQREEEKTAKRAHREAENENFRVKYRTAFPNWTFFFNTSLEIRASFAPRIQELGARCESFFSSKVTHVITSHRYTSGGANKENLYKHHSTTLRSPIKLSAKPSKVDEDLIEKAKQFEMKIWDIEKLDSVLNRVQTSSRSPKIARSPKLNEILEAERRSGITTERDPYARRSDFEYFPRNCCFVLIEDMNGHYSTISAQGFPIQTKNGVVTGPWPTLYLDPRSNSPFAPYDNKEAKRRAQALESEKLRKQEKKLRQLRKRQQAEKGEEQQHLAGGLRRTVSMIDLAAGISEQEREEQDIANQGLTAQVVSGFAETAYLAASGNSVSVISGTGTTSATGLAHRSIAPPALRRQLANQVVMKRNLGEAQPTLRKSKSTSTMRLPRRDETLKPGFCESCRTKFQDFRIHIKSKRHRRFAINDENFLELDCVLARVERRSLRQLEQMRYQNLHYQESHAVIAGE